jgi:predicted aldo/keto reductase-like oxidoreductase
MPCDGLHHCWQCNTISLVLSPYVNRQFTCVCHGQLDDAAVEAITLSGLIDGVILYWNAFQRDCSDTAWTSICEKSIPALALRTLGGGPLDKNSQPKSEQLARLIKKAGCRNATDFNLRLAASEPAIQTTIGGTSSLAHLEDFLFAADQPVPLPPGILTEVRTLQALK